MKLIDLLVQELPKRGGWPCGDVAYQDSDREVRFMGEGMTHGDFIAESLCSPDGNCQVAGIRHAGPVTRKQYEAALAKSQQSAWSGDGLPPVGIECEFREQHVEQWQKGVVRYISDYTIVIDISPEEDEVGDKEPCFENDGNISFRPIRTEADRKREETVNYINMNVDDMNEHLAGNIYDLIASGDVPNLKLE